MTGLIFFRQDGGIVIGFPVELVNEAIRKWNKEPESFRASATTTEKFTSFFNWFMMEREGEDYRLQDFSALWNFKNPAMRHLVTIK